MKQLLTIGYLVTLDWSALLESILSSMANFKGVCEEANLRASQSTEARVNELYDAGWLTPSNLFYVVSASVRDNRLSRSCLRKRNHGAVPKVDKDMAANWKLRVHGMVESECSFKLEDLMSRFETVTLPITLVCAGNRRKEQNVISKSLGFNWGSGSVDQTDS